jgi:hypothetical protein
MTDNENVAEVGRDETVDTNAGPDATQGTIADAVVEEPEYREEAPAEDSAPAKKAAAKKST